MAERAPALTPDPGWEPYAPFRLESGRGTFVSEDPQGDRLRVAYFRRPQAPQLVGRAWFGPGAEGPPGHSHGGAIAAVLDEAMGAAAWLAGHLVVAVHLATDFRRMLPLGTDAHLEAWIESVERRKVAARGRLFDDGGEPFAEARGLFLEIDPERFSLLIERAARAQGLEPSALLATAAALRAQR